jgi:phospholipid/cholesterol/gamma-HCH transport system substrate-binding protein
VLGDNGLARVALGVEDGVKASDDAVASIETEGLIGDTVVSITSGTSDNRLYPGERIGQTESSSSLRSSLGKWFAGDLS